MKAVVYQDAFTVAAQDVPDARIQAQTDAVITIKTTNICGSDLHMYEGRTSVEAGKILLECVGCTAFSAARRAMTGQPVRRCTPSRCGQV